MLTKFSEQVLYPESTGQPGFTKTLTCSYNKIADGVFTPKGANIQKALLPTSFSSDTQADLVASYPQDQLGKKEKKGDIEHSSLAISSFDFGDLKLPSNYFDVYSLPHLQPGITVLDQRGGSG